MGCYDRPAEIGFAKVRRWPRKRRNPDCYTGKRATTDRERGAPVRKARILGSMGGGVGVVDFCGRGAVRDEGIGRRGSGQGGKERGRERAGFRGRGVVNEF